MLIETEVLQLTEELNRESEDTKEGVRGSRASGGVLTEPGEVRRGSS